jgi:NAD+ synthase (glutamine-hydrolysing)
VARREPATGRRSSRTENKRATRSRDIRKWLEVFLYRFFEISQFKRSAPERAESGFSGGNLSPRGDWRAPSDGNARVWLEELERNVPER